MLIQLPPSQAEAYRRFLDSYKARTQKAPDASIRTEAYIHATGQKAGEPNWMYWR